MTTDQKTIENLLNQVEDLKKENKALILAIDAINDKLILYDFFKSIKGKMKDSESKELLHYNEISKKSTDKLYKTNNALSIPQAIDNSITTILELTNELIGNYNN